MALTHTQINKLKPSDKCKPSRPDKHSHADGLQLWVRHTGNKVWYSAYRYQGKQQTLQLGKYPVLTLQQAIKRNLEVKQLIANGIDPKDKKKAEKAKQDGSKTFDNIAQAWYAERKTYLAPKTFSRNYSAYKRDVKPFIGHLSIDDIRSPDVLAIGKAIESRGAVDMAKRTIREVGAIFKHAIRQGLTLHNPATDISEAIKPNQSKNHNRITYNQLPKLLSDIDNYTGYIVKMGLSFICYTFLRTNEVRFLEWCDIDFKNKMITIPAEKMKAKRKHLIPLAPQVIALLHEIKTMALSEQYVFVNASTRKPLSSHAFIKAMYDMGYKGKMTVHGYRGLASTTLHEKKYMHEAIELQLAHDKENKISKAYDGSQHLEYRTQMMNDWANLIDKARAGEINNIVHFPSEEDKQTG